MALTINADTPGGAGTAGSALTKQQWDDTLESALYERQWFLQKTKKRQRGFLQLNVRKMGIVAGQTLSTTNDGQTMNLDSMVSTVVALLPQWLFAGHAYSDALEWSSTDTGVIERAAADNVENGLAAYQEAQYLADVASGTQFIGNNAYDSEVVGIRAVIALLRSTALGLAEPGDVDIYGLFYALQHDDLMSIPEFTHAEQRGDGVSPLVSGMVGKGNGMTFGISTLQASDGNGRHNPVWVPSAFSYFYNSPPKGEKQRFMAQNRVFAQTHFGHGVVFNSRFVDVRTRAA